MKERWKKVSDYPYEVSDLGRVRSIQRLVRNRYGYVERPSVVLKPFPTRKGYLMVDLRKDGKSKKRSVHLLVIHAFGPKKPSASHQCNHIDTIKTHNWIDNLEWVTPKGNMQHAKANGLRPDLSGINHPQAKLSKSQAVHIRRLYDTGKHSQRSIAKSYGVSQKTVYNVLHGRHWA